MQDVVLRVIQTAAAPGRAWTSELWSGSPGGGGAARLAGGPASFTQGQLEAPAADGTLLDRESVLDKIRNQDQPDGAFAAVGLRLYDLLDQTGTAAAWRALHDAEEAKVLAGTPNAGLRTYLDLPEFLADWPWELLAWRVDAGLYARAFNMTRHPVLRVVAPAAALPPLGEVPLRILLVSGQEALDAANLASTELRLIRKIFHATNLSVMVDLLEAPPNVGELERRIVAVAPHVLHFIGHGDIPPGGDFVLEFKRATPWEWSANQVHQFLTNLRTKPRLVVLNSCHSSRREAHTAPITGAILRAGVPAVVGALAALQIDYARHFSEAFYTALAARLPIDQAMATARDTLSKLAQYAGLERRHWALPVLTVAAPAPEILPLRRSAALPSRCEVAGDLLARPGKFVNRTSDRWSMLSAFRPADPTAPRFRGVVVEGTAAQVGKGWLMKRAMRDFFDSNWVVRYATLVGPDARTSLDVLQDWRGRPHAVSPFLQPLPAPHFDAFDAALAAARADRNARNIDEVFRTFKAGFQSVRAGRNVVLVLGRFRETGLPTVGTRDFGEQLLEKLLLPIQATEPADDEVEGLHALLVARTYDTMVSGLPRDFDEYSLNRVSLDVPDESTRQPSDGFRRLTVREFPTTDLDRYFDEFADFTQNDGVEGLRTLMKFMVQQPTWSPARLKEYEPLMQQALKRP
jgi:hypothetical protein